MFTSNVLLPAHPAIELQKVAAARSRFVRSMRGWIGNPVYIARYQEDAARQYFSTRLALGLLVSDYEHA